MCDKELNTAIYGDSLGWPAPGKLVQKINRYVKGFSGEQENILLRECHNSNSNRQGSHVCKNDCCVIYPLQKDGDICGIVCIVVASIVCLAPGFWKYILITKCLVERVILVSIHMNLQNFIGISKRTTQQ